MYTQSKVHVSHAPIMEEEQPVRATMMASPTHEYRSPPKATRSPAKVSTRSPAKQFVHVSPIKNGSGTKVNMSKTMPKNNSFYIAPLVSDTIAMGGDPNMKTVVT